MSKDDRLYAKFTLDFADHHKILPLSDAAFRCLIEATLWSRKQLTNGLLPRSFALVRWSLDVLNELSTNDPLKPSLVECPEGWIIHDFALHQATKEELETLSAVRKRAGQAGGKASAQARRSKRQANAQASAEPNGKQNQARDRDRDREELTTDVVSSRAAQAQPTKKRATRIAADWMPDQPVIEAMKAERPDVDLEAEHRKFIDYWLGKSGQAATKVDWNATWRNWIRNARGGTATNGTRLVGADKKAMDWMELAERMDSTNNGKEIEA